MESASCVQPLALTLNPLDTNAIAKEGEGLGAQWVKSTYQLGIKMGLQHNYLVYDRQVLTDITWLKKFRRAVCL